MNRLEQCKGFVYYKQNTILVIDHSNSVASEIILPSKYPSRSVFLDSGIGLPSGKRETRKTP